jgi:predicted O-linked N-acetylglucosamine transferase (SPINDLY family)
MGNVRTDPSRALQLGLQLHQRGQIDQAASHYQAVLAAQPGHFDALHLLGLVRFQQGRLAEATDHIKAALGVKPNAAGALSNLGMVLATQGRPEEALAIFDKALAVEPRNAEAHNNRGNVLLHLARFKDAVASFNRALAIQPANFEALNSRGEALLGLDRPAEALASFDKALALRRDQTQALCNRGNALLALDRHHQALASFNKALGVKPDYADALNGRGTALLRLKQPEKALGSFDKALALAPDLAQALNNRGNALLDLKRPEEALASFDKALATRPDYAEALTNRGIALGKLMRPEEALASYDRALAIKPHLAQALNNRSNVLLVLKRPVDALASLDKALNMNPADAEALYNRGLVFLDLSQPAEALASLDRALALKPEHADALCCRGDALVDLGRAEQALASFEKALAIAPDNAAAVGGVLLAALRACRWTRVREILASQGSQTGGQSPIAALGPFFTLACCDDPSVQLDCARQSVQSSKLTAAPRWTAPPRSGGKLRIAYISADFRNHAIATLFSELFRLHDRTRFDVIGISTGTDDRSNERSRIAKAFDRFLDVRYKCDQDAAEILRELEVDIAIDLTGHTRDTRLGILASRPAPIQVSYLGYPGTTGADFIDYVIADPIVLPFDQQPYYTERIVHLPDTYQVNDCKRAIPSSAPTREACGLPEDAFVFCCFNNNYKITQEIFEVWMRLLAANPGSVLWLYRSNEDVERNLREVLRRGGVDSARLLFAEPLPYRAHLARHLQADLFLDTLPYNAHTTASDALWAGLPVVTCMGRTFAARVAASLLHAAGLPELVTHSLADYEALAMRLASDRALLEQYRQRLQANRRTCALFDTARFARNIELAYIQMWEIHQRGEDPQSFRVPG